MPTYSFLPNPKGQIGSSQYAIAPMPFKGTGTSTGTDYPIYSPDGSGKLVSKNTGLPFTGTNPFNGKAYANGAEVAPGPGKQFIPGTTTAIDPNNVAQRYQAVSVEKNPGVSSAADALAAEFKKTADTGLEDFSSYLKNFKDQIGVANQQGQAATNIGPYSSALTGAQGRYSNTLDTAVTNAGQTNADLAAKEAQIQAQARGDLGLYDTAANNAENLALGALQKRVSRYKLAGSTPTSLGSDELAMLQSGARDITVPIELQKAEKRAALTTGLDLPIAQGDAARQAQFWQSFVPGVAGSQYQSNADVLGQIQKLKMTVSGLSYQNALQYMQSIGVPPQIQQQILSGQIGELGGLNSVYAGSKYQGLQDVLGTNITQPIGYSPTFGGLPAPRYTVPNAPVTVSASPGAGAPVGGGYNPYGNTGVDPAAWAAYTAQLNRNVVPYSRYGGPITPGAGAPAGGYQGYDPATGLGIGTEPYLDVQASRMYNADSPQVY